MIDFPMLPSRKYMLVYGVVRWAELGRTVELPDVALEIYASLIARGEYRGS